MIRGDYGPCRCHYCALWKDRCVSVDTSPDEYSDHKICAECFVKVLNNASIVMAHSKAPVGWCPKPPAWWNDPSVPAAPEKP